MKFYIWLLLFCYTTNIIATEYSAGVVVGTPTGLSGKADLNSKNFFSLGFSGGYIHTDYNWYRNAVIKNYRIKWYYGPGIVIQKSLGLRGVTGLEHIVNKSSFHVFTETSFHILFKSDIDTKLGIALGGRYTF